MSTKISFLVSVLIFIAGAYFIFNSYINVDFNPPSAGGFTLEGFMYMLGPAGAFSAGYFLEKIIKKGGGWVFLGASIVLLVGSFFGFVFAYDWFTSRDLENNGVVLEAHVVTADFEWVHGTNHDHLYLRYSYDFMLNGKAHHYIRWLRLNDYGLTMQANPTVDYNNFPNKPLYHVGDSFNLKVSSVNPSRQRFTKVGT